MLLHQCPVYKAIIGNFHPPALPFRFQHRPKRAAAVFTLVVLLILLLEKELVCLAFVPDALGENIHHDRLAAVRAQKGMFPPVVCHSRAAHIAVPRLFLRDNDIAVLVPLLEHFICLFQLGGCFYLYGKGIRRGFRNLPQPFFRQVGRAEHDVEMPAAFLRLVRVQRCDADFRFACAAFRNTEGGFVLPQAPHDGFRNGKLRIIKPIARLFLDISVDRQHFLGNLLSGRVEQGRELPLYFACNAPAEPVQVGGYGRDFLKSVCFCTFAGNGNLPCFQPMLHDFDDVLLVF